MKKWITGTAIACTILSTNALAASAKSLAVDEKMKELFSCCQQYGISLKIPELENWFPQISFPEWNGSAPELNTPEAERPETDTPIPDTETAPNVQDSTYAKQVLDLVNTARAQNGLSPLTLDTSLNAVALAHSRDMADRNYFSHASPEGKRLADRLKAAGISYSAAGENIAVGQKSPEQVVNSWMKSEGHRKNILNASFNKMGLGFVKKQGGYGTYWTQVFTN